MADLEKLARQTIDAMLFAAGWVVQDYKHIEGRGITLREVPLKRIADSFCSLLTRLSQGILSNVPLSVIKLHVAKRNSGEKPSNPNPNLLLWPSGWILGIRMFKPCPDNAVSNRPTLGAYPSYVFHAGPPIFTFLIYDKTKSSFNSQEQK
jgi:hypothetical protein